MKKNAVPKGCPKLEEIIDYYQKNAPKKLPKKIIATKESSESESDSDDDEPAVKTNGVTNGKAAVANGNGKKKDSSDDSDSSEDVKPAVKAPAKPVVPPKQAAKKQESSDDSDSSEEEQAKKPQVKKTSFCFFNQKIYLNFFLLSVGKKTRTSKSTG